MAVEFTFRETSLTSLSFRELPKITKLHLEIFRVNGLLENQLETVAKSEFNLLSRQIVIIHSVISVKNNFTGKLTRW